MTSKEGLCTSSLCGFNMTLFILFYEKQINANKKKKAVPGPFLPPWSIYCTEDQKLPSSLPWFQESNEYKQIHHFHLRSAIE